MPELVLQILIGGAIQVRHVRLDVLEHPITEGEAEEVVEAIGDVIVGLSQGDVLIDGPGTEVVAELALRSSIQVGVERRLATAALVAPAASAYHPPLDPRACVFQVEQQLVVGLPAQVADPVTAALRTLLRPSVLDLRVHLQPPLALAELAFLTLANSRTGADVNLFTLIVRVSALVDMLQFRAEELDLAEAEGSEPLEVIDLGHGGLALDRARRRSRADGEDELGDPL